MIRRSLSVSCPGDEDPGYMLICEPAIRKDVGRRWQMDRPQQIRVSPSPSLERAPLKLQLTASPTPFSIRALPRALVGRRPRPVR